MLYPKGIYYKSRRVVLRVVQGGIYMTIEERIERLEANLSKGDKQYDLIGIYENEHAYKCYCS